GGGSEKGPPPGGPQGPAPGGPFNPRAPATPPPVAGGGTRGGEVLPGGGGKEKFLAGKGAGGKQVILAAENRQNVEEDLMPEQVEGVKIHYASRIEDVLAIALPVSKAEVRKDDQVREE